MKNWNINMLTVIRKKKEAFLKFSQRTISTGLECRIRADLDAVDSTSVY